MANCSLSRITCLNDLDHVNPGFPGIEESKNAEKIPDISRADKRGEWKISNELHGLPFSCRKEWPGFVLNFDLCQKNTELVTCMVFFGPYLM